MWFTKKQKKQELITAFTGFTATGSYLMSYRVCEGECNFCKTTYICVFMGQEL